MTYELKTPAEAQPVDGAAAEVIEEMRSRMSSRGRVGDGPVYGAELIGWANRLEAALAPQPPDVAQRCSCPSGDGSLRWPCPVHPPEAQPVDGVVCLECGQPTMPIGQVCYSCLHPPTAPPSAPVGVELLCRVYADAYHHGHHATVEGEYVDVLPADRDTYWREKVEEDYTEELAQQPAADPLVEWANRPLNYTATVGVFKDGVRIVAKDDLNDWRAAFIAERATRYRESGMSIESARIHAETDAACIDADALAAQQGGES